MLSQPNHIFQYLNGLLWLTLLPMNVINLEEALPLPPKHY